MAKESVNTVVWKANTTDIRKAVKELKNSLKNMGASASLEDVKEKFKLITESGADAKTRISEITKLMKEMQFNGMGGTDLFKEMAKSAVDARKEINYVRDSIKEIESASQTLTPEQTFDSITNSTAGASDKLKEMKQLMVDLMSSGQGDSELFKKALSSAVSYDEELNRVQESQKKVNELISGTNETSQNLTLGDKLESIVNSGSDANTVMKQLTELMTEVIELGESDMPIGEEIKKAYEEASKSVEQHNQSALRAKEILTGISNESQNLTLDQKFKQITESEKNSGDKLKECKKLIEEYIASGKRLTPEELKRYTNELKKLKSQTDANIKAQEQFNKALGTSKLSLSQGIQGLSGMATSLTGLTAMFGKFGGDASAGIQKVAGSIASLQGIQATLSSGVMANPYVAAGAAIAAMTAAIVDYNIEFEKTLNRTAQFTGLSGNALTSLRNGIKACADTWGKDYNTILEGVDSLMSQFGVSGEKALEIISKGFQSGADESGHMLDLIKRYGGAFHDMGISAEELTAIIANTRSGIFTEEGMKIISDAGRRIREMSKETASSLDAIGINSDEMFRKLQTGEISTVQAVKEVSKAVSENGAQTQKVGDVISKVFGKEAAKSGSELISFLKDMDTELDSIVNQTGDWGKAMKELEDANRELENAMSSLFAIGEGGFENLVTTIKTKAIRAIAEFLNYIIDLYNNSLYVRASWQSVVATFKTVWEVGKMMAKDLAELFKNFAGVIEGILTFDPKKISNSISELYSAIGKNAVDMAKAVGEDWSKAFNETVNGQIKKVKIESPEESVNKSNKKNSNQTVNKKTQGTSSSKTEKIDYLVAIDDGSLDMARKKLKAFEDKKTKINVSDTDALAECQKEIDKWQKEVERRELIVNVDINKTELERVQSEIKKLKENKAKIDPYLNSEELNKIETEINSLKQEKINLELQFNSEELSKIETEIKSLQEEKVNLELDFNYEELKRIETEISSLKQEKINLDPELDRNRIEEIDSLISGLQSKALEITVQNSDAVNRISEIDSLISGLQNKALQIRIENSDAIDRISEIDSQITGLQDKALEITVQNSDAVTKINDINNQIKNLEDKEFEIKVAYGDIEGGPLARIKREIDSLNKEKIKLDPETDQSKIDDIVQKISDLEKKEHIIKVAYREIDEASINFESPKFQKGNIVDKRQSLDNVRSRISEIQSDFSNNLIDKAEAQRQVDEVITAIQTNLPELELKFKVNDDGTITEIKKDMTNMGTEVGNVAGAFNGLGNALSSLTDDEGVAKAALIAQAIGTLALTFAKSMGATTGPWEWIAGAISGIATLTAMVSQMQSFSTGGIVGGSALAGDTIVSRLNSGEMVLNKQQQRHLFDQLDSPTVGGMGGTVHFEIQSDKLVGVLNNRDKKMKRIKG